MSEEEWVDVEEGDWEDVQTDEAPEDGPSLGSEAAKVAGQAAVGASQGLLDIGNKPFSELAAGEVGKNLNEGVLIANKIKAASKSDIATTIKRFVESGPMGIAQSMEVNQGDTLHTKYGFPVLPQPETGVGKALGMAAKIAGQAATLAPFEGKLSPSSNLKMPKAEQVEKAISKIDENVRVIKETNKENLFRTQDGIDSNAIAQRIKDSELLAKFETDKTRLADSTALEIQGKPGNKGLAVQASKKLGEEFNKEYQKFAGEQVHVDDVMDGFEKVLQQYGVINGAGERIPDIELNPAQAKALKFYESIKAKEPGVIQLDSKRITLGELDKGLKSMFGKGKQYGSEEHILTDLRHSMSDYVAPLREIGKQFAGDFQLRNSIYDKFHVFDRIGFRRGSGDQSSGIGVLKNLAEEDPASILPQNQRMMEFIKKYSGVDPSEPVRKVGQNIVGVKKAAQTREIGSRVLLQNMKRDIFNTELKADKSAAEMKASLDRLKASALTKEAKAQKEANIKKYLATAAGAGTIGALATGLVRKVVD